MGLIFILDGRPVFFVSERMRNINQGFKMIKFRTMQVSNAPLSASGGHISSRVTKLGAFLRKYRLDEIPQIFNIIKGDMSFVGPRPPLRRYVESNPDLYREVLNQKTGVTCLSTLYLSDYEARILSTSKSAEETEELYIKLCIPKKAKLDLIYADHRSSCFDIVLLIRTIKKVFTH